MIRLFLFLGLLLEATTLIDPGIAWKIANKGLFCLYLSRILRVKVKELLGLRNFYGFFPFFTLIVILIIRNRVNNSVAVICHSLPTKH
jgi:hypothetical protein